MPMFADSNRGLAATLTIAGLIVAALVLGREILIPFALATILAFMLAPIVRFLSNRRVPRGAAVGSVVLALVAVLIVISLLFSAQLLSLTASLSGYKENLTQKVRLVTGSQAGDSAIRKAAESVDILEQEFKKESNVGVTSGKAPSIVVTQEKTSSLGVLFDQLRIAVGPLAGAGLTLLFAGFLLVQHNDIRDRVVRLAGTDNMAATTSALGEAASRLSRLFLMQAVLNAGFGAFIGIALAVIGVPNAILWGVATFLLRFIPFVGSFLSAIPPILLAAAVDPGWGMVGATIALFVISEPLVGHVIEPYVLGGGVGLSPFAMVVAASFWALVWGPIGLILAAPLTMSIVVLGRYIPRLEFMSVLLGDKPALAPEHEFYHRVLSDDAAAAADQLEQAIIGTSVVVASDDIVLPALRVAARDHRVGRLVRTQIDAIQQTMNGVVELMVDQGDDTDASVSGRATAEDAERRQIIVVPARGPIDSIAARYIATIVRNNSDWSCISVEQATGLMALSACRTLASGKPLDTVIISTVGGIDQQHLRLLVGRAQKDLPTVRLLICDWGGVLQANSTAIEPLQPLVTAISRLTDVVMLLTHDRASDARELKELETVK